MPRAPRLELAGPGEQPDETGSEDEVPSQNALAALPWARALALAGRMANKGKRLDLRQGEFASTQSLGWVRDHARLVAAAAAAQNPEEAVAPNLEVADEAQNPARGETFSAAVVEVGACAMRSI